MKRSRAAQIGLGALLALGCMIILVEPALRRDDALQAAQWQFLGPEPRDALVGDVRGCTAIVVPVGSAERPDRFGVLAPDSIEKLWISSSVDGAGTPTASGSDTIVERWQARPTDRVRRQLGSGCAERLSAAEESAYARSATEHAP